MNTRTQERTIDPAQITQPEKVAIYDLEAGQLSTTRDLTAQELTQAKNDIAAIFSRIPESTKAIIWERGRVRAIQQTPDGTPTNKLFFDENGRLYPATR